MRIQWCAGLRRRRRAGEPGRRGPRRRHHRGDRGGCGSSRLPVRPADPSRNHLCTAPTAALRQLAAAGVPLLAGTDTGLPTAALGVFGYGATLHGELQLLVEAGLSPPQALVAATSAPAQAFRLTDRGRIQPGMRADLVLVDGDPTQDIGDTRNLVTIWKRGARLELAEPGN